MGFTTNIQPLLDSLGKLSDSDKLELGRLMFKKYVTGGSIAQVHDIQTDVRKGDPIAKVDTGNSWEYAKDLTGTSECADTDCNIAPVFSTKVWNPNRYGCTPEICFGDLEKKAKDYFRANETEGDPTQSDWYDFFVNIIGQYVQNSHWTKAWFTDTASANDALTGIDGLFKQMYAVATPANTAQRYEIAENSAATAAAQLALGANTAKDTYEWMMMNRPNEIMGENLAIYTSRSLFKNFQQWVWTNKVMECCEANPTTAQYDLSRLNIGGIPIVVVSAWDEIIKNVGDFFDGTVYDMPHRAVLTYRENIPLGTPNGGELEEVDFRFDPYTENSKFVTKYSIDAKLVEDDDFIIAS